MGFYKEHLDVVKKRWENHYKTMNFTAEEFKKRATRTLKSYGWEDKEIEYILKDIK